jgi:carboxypeptidase Taq
MATEADEAPDAYRELIEEYGKYSNVGAASGVLGWDQQVMMPEGGTPARAQQLSTLSSISHDILTGDGIGDRLDALSDADLTGRQAAAVREIRRNHRRAVRVPNDLVERISEATSESQPVWQDAKAEDDWDAFEPTLEEIVQLKREYAAAIDPDRDPYEVLFESYEPYLPLDTAERVLERLRDELVPLVDAISESDADLATPFDGEFDADEQFELSRDALSALGYDFDRGRLDVAPHPFSTGTTFDARVTSRYDESDLLGGISSTIHEFGHANYTLGLPDDAYGTPLGESRDMTVHESQSRFWENHVGRTGAFWEFFLPSVQDRFPSTSDVTPRQAYEAANQVYPDNLIRVEADELTYHMHIILRWEIERDLIRGNLDVSELPAVWNEKMDEYLGVTPDAVGDGPLQDIHWSQGSFGYFPTYSLGSVLAAQLHAAVEDDLGDLDELVREGEFEPIREWHTENVHRHGSRYTTPDLVEHATGEAYTADYFLDYAKEKFGALYNL